MAGSQPSPFSNAFATPLAGSLRYNTSQYGSVVPVLWGTQRVSVNLIDMFGFVASGGSNGKGGKGIGSSGGKKGGSAQYSVDVDFALCTGPVTFTGAAAGDNGQNWVWANGGVAGGLGAVGLNGYTGAAGQSPDPTFAATDPNQPVPGYSLTAHVTGTPMQLGSTPALPSIQFQLGGRRVGTAGTSFPDDARPDYVVADLLADPNVGAGFPATNIADLSQYGAFCQASGLAISLLCRRQDTAARWLKQIAELTVAGVFFSGTQLKVVPYRAASFTGYGASYAPDLTPLYTLTDDDFLNWEDDGLEGPTNTRGGARRDPIEITRKDPAEQWNWLSLEYQPSSYAYDSELISGFDQGAIDQYGLRLKPSTPAHMFTNATSAGSSVQLLLQREQYNLNQYKFRLGIAKCLIEPMDILAVSESISGLSGALVRVIAVEEDDKSTYVVTAEDLFNIPALPWSYTTGTGGNGLGINPLSAPGSTNPPVLFEPPVPLTNGQNEIWIVASGGAQWGGCEVWLSLDGTTYGQYGVIYAGGRQGVLSASFPTGSDPDTTDTLAVDLTESRGSLTAGTQADADAFVTLCWCDGELIAFSAATLTAQYQYDLGTYIRRGVYGTTIAAHAKGAQFARLDNAVFKLAFPPNLAPGQTFYVKLPAFNLFGLEAEELSAVTAFTYTTNGAGASKLDIAGSYVGQPPAGADLQDYTFAATATFPTGFAGSVGRVKTAPAGSVSFSIQQNGAQIGTMNFAAGQRSATFTLAGGITFQIGDTLSVVAPSPQDATLKTPSWTLVATA